MVEVENALEEVEESLGAIRSAEGGVKHTETIVEFHRKVDELHDLVRERLTPGTQASGTRLSDCILPNGTLDPEC